MLELKKNRNKARMKAIIYNITMERGDTRTQVSYCQVILQRHDHSDGLVEIITEFI